MMVEKVLAPGGWGLEHVGWVGFILPRKICKFLAQAGASIAPPNLFTGELMETPFQSRV